MIRTHFMHWLLVASCGTLVTGCATLMDPEAPREYVRSTVAGLIGIPYPTAEKARKTSSVSSTPFFSRLPGHMSGPATALSSPEPTNDNALRPLAPGVQEILARRQAWHDSDSASVAPTVTRPVIPPAPEAACPIGSANELSPLSASAPVAPPPAPDPWLPAMERLVALYRTFHYAEIIAEAEDIVRDPTRPTQHKANIFIVAAASAYILGDAQKMRYYLVQALRTDPSRSPSTDYFPSELCRMHRALRDGTQ